MALKGVGVAVAEPESPLPVEDTVAVALEESVAVGDAKSFASTTDLPDQAPDKKLTDSLPDSSASARKGFHSGVGTGAAHTGDLPLHFGRIATTDRFHIAWIRLSTGK